MVNKYAVVKWSFFSSVTQKQAIACFCVFSIACIFSSITMPSISYLEVLLSLFDGYRLDGLNIPEFLRYVILPSISILSREQKFSSYLKARILTLSLSLVMILFFHILLTFLMGVGLMGTTGTYLTGYAYFDEILQLFSSRFSSPYVAVCLVLLNYLLGLVCVSSIVGVILIYFPRKIRVASLVVLYLIIFFGVQRSAMWNLEPFFISNYVLLSNAITTDLFPGSIVVMLVITILVLSFVCKRWWKAKSW